MRIVDVTDGFTKVTYYTCNHCPYVSEKWADMCDHVIQLHAIKIPYYEVDD